MFLSLTSPDLPDTNPSTGKGGVLLRLYRNERHLAPIFRYDRYAAYLPGVAEPEIIPLEVPDYGGYFYTVNLPVRVSQILTAGVLVPTTSPLSGTPGSIWHDESRAVVYLYPGLNLSDGSTVSISARVQRPTFSLASTTISVEAAFTVATVEAGGLTFTQVGGTPGLGQFSQSGGVVTLGVGAGYNLPSTTIATLTGSFDLVLPAPSGIGLSFNLSNVEIDSLDGAEFLGLSYVPSADVYRPAVGEYFWDGNTLTLFAESGAAANLTKAPSSIPGFGSVGSVSYESWEVV